MNTNLLPAILLAGPPHSGKSVLSYALSQRLRQHGIQHVLLRVAPDGEGDWFYQTDVDLRVLVRQKGEFTPELMERVTAAIQNRVLPLLVDVGGRPTDDQLGPILACTHFVQLFREDSDRKDWQQRLQPTRLLPIAELQSQLEGPDVIADDGSPLQGVITGLECGGPRLGPLFDLVYERVAGICAYPAPLLEAEHLRAAPAGIHLLVLPHLAAELGVAKRQGDWWWEPIHLQALMHRLTDSGPVGMYGRGPVWLYAAIAAHTAPSPLYVFDARFYGWMPATPAYTAGQANPELRVTTFAQQGATWIHIDCTQSVIAPTPVYLPEIPGGHGVIIDGKLPNWLWAAVAASLTAHPWLGIWVPQLARVVVIWSRSGRTIGETFAIDYLPEQLAAV